MERLSDKALRSPHTREKAYLEPRRGHTLTMSSLHAARVCSGKSAARALGMAGSWSSRVAAEGLRTNHHHTRLRHGSPGVNRGNTVAGAVGRRGTAKVWRDMPCCGTGEAGTFSSAKNAPSLASLAGTSSAGSKCSCAKASKQALRM